MARIELPRTLEVKTHSHRHVWTVVDAYKRISNCTCGAKCERDGAGRIVRYAESGDFGDFARSNREGREP